MFGSRPARLMRASMSFRNSAHRSTLALLLLASAGIMLIGKADPTTYERARMAVTDLATPILDIVSRPVTAGSELIDSIGELAAVHASNQALREENERLRRWRAVAQGLESENEKLRSMLNFVPPAPASFISGRVIGDSGGAFLRSVLVNVGRNHGVRKGAAAVDGSGLLGRVAEVGNWSSRVLLVTDLNSRIPVLVGDSRERAILTGDNSDRPRLDYLPQEISISQGDLVVTSGHGGAFPAGLPVGVVEKSAHGELRVNPFLSPQRLEFVRVMDFGLTGVLQDQEIDPGGAQAGL